MKIVEIKSLSIPAIKVIKFARFCDHRGYFTESFRKSDFVNHPKMEFMKDVEFVQVNESLSKQGVIRGMHFQWNPYMGKLVRTIKGRMVDMGLIRLYDPLYSRFNPRSNALHKDPKADQGVGEQRPPTGSF